MAVRQFRRGYRQDAGWSATRSPGGRQVRHPHPAARATAKTVVPFPATTVRGSACRQVRPPGTNAASGCISHASSASSAVANRPSQVGNPCVADSHRSACLPGQMLGGSRRDALISGQPPCTVTIRPGSQARSKLTLTSLGEQSRRYHRKHEPISRDSAIVVRLRRSETFTHIINAEESRNFHDYPRELHGIFLRGLEAPFPMCDLPYFVVDSMSAMAQALCLSL